MSSATFAGVPKFLAAQLQQDWGYVKRGRAAQSQVRKNQEVIRLLCMEFEHLANVSKRKLYLLVEHLGEETVRQLAKNNLSGHFFVQAGMKMLYPTATS